MTQHYVDPFGPPWRFSWIRLMLQWEGGIFQMIWLEMVIAVSLCAIALTAVYFGYKYDDDGVQQSVKSLSDAVNFVARRFQAAIALMLGFYTVQSFTRWREARGIAGNCMGTINDLALQIAWRIRETDGSEGKLDAIAEGEEENVEQSKNLETTSNDSSSCPHAIDVRLKLIRWLNLANALVMGDVYEMKYNAFASLDNLVNYGLATQAEAAFLAKQESRFKYVAPFQWFISQLEHLQKKELLGVDDGTVNTLSAGAVQIRRLLADLYGVKDMPLPLSYRQLTNITVRCYMIFLLLGAILFEIQNEYAYGSLSRGSFWILLVYAWEYFLFVGWLTVADAIQNPFRRWADQLDWDDYVKELNASSILIATQFHGEAAKVETLEDESDDADAVESEKLVKQVNRWAVSINHNKKNAPLKGLKGARKVATGF